MWSNPQETAGLVTFTEEILNGKLHFLCSVVLSMQEELASYLEVIKIYTALDIKFPRVRNLREITKLNPCT